MPCQVLSPALTEDGLREVLLGALEGDASGDIPEIHFHILKCRILGRKNHMDFCMTATLEKVRDIVRHFFHHRFFNAHEQGWELVNNHYQPRETLEAGVVCVFQLDSAFHFSGQGCQCLRCRRAFSDNRTRQVRQALKWHQARSTDINQDKVDLGRRFAVGNAGNKCLQTNGLAGASGESGPGRP